jgi:hypothetical protein
MFANCTLLATAPELPATTLKTSCYNGMFSGCTSLTTAPELPATTLVSSCYNYMFRNCSSLKYISAMFTTTPSSSYTSNWVAGVASSGTFVKANNANWSVTGVYGVPSGWTVKTNQLTIVNQIHISGSGTAISVYSDYNVTSLLTVIVAVAGIGYQEYHISKGSKNGIRISATPGSEGGILQSTIVSITPAKDDTYNYVKAI